MVIAIDRNEAPVLDAGCGRGELLGLLRDAGVEARGIDADGDMVAYARGDGLEVEQADLVDGSRVEAGDSVIGFASAGVHANGFTLVRRVLADELYDGPDLLAPTVLYQFPVEELVRRADVHAFAHVTGGGIVGNLSRVLPKGREAAIDWNAWERPAVFDWLARHVDEAELRNVFNLGIGFCAVLPADQAAGELVIGEIR